MKNLYFLLLALFTSFIASADIGPITGPTATCIGGTLALSDTTAGGVWSTGGATTGTIDPATGVFSGGSQGVETITYSVAGNFVTTAVTVEVLPDIIFVTGPSSVCVGATVTLDGEPTGGAWSATNSNATVASGVVTGVIEGVDTILYTIANTCGTMYSHKTIHIDTPDAGSLSGAATVCAGAATTLTPTISGGTWSASNTKATVSGGVVTGVTAGTDTITYTVTNSCGTATTTYEMTISPLPDAAVISGPTSVCPSATITLTASVTGGAWSVSNGNAAVSAGVVTGNLPGVDTIIYTVTNSCGPTDAIYIVTVSAVPDAGSISGTAAICAGDATTLTATVADGVWNASNGNATVVAGLVTGVAEGVDTIAYTVISTCGSATSTYEVTVNAAPAVAAISGANTVCQSATITLTDAAGGGVWSISNGNASVSGGTITGINAGLDTVSYTISNACGISTATYEISVNPLPVAGTISGPTIACVGAMSTLTASATGGTWSATNGKTTVAAGVVTGVATGLDTIVYTVTNSCGAVIATYPVTVNTIPAAGTISGLATVCEAASLSLTDGVTAGTWSASNSNATVTGGTVIGVTAGGVTISYTVTNTCGSGTAIKNITVNPLPPTGTITGPANVCPGGAITLTSSVTGGVWAASNGHVTVSSGGVVTGISAGAVIVSYSFTNSCGTASASSIIIVDPLPDAGTISGASSVCIGGTVALTSTIGGGVWFALNSNATITALGLVHGASAGIDTFLYTVTNSCGAAAAMQVMTINPLPSAVTLSGPSTVCQLATATLTSTVTGGVWAASNSHATVAGGVVTGVTAGTVAISYTFTNVCGTSVATKLMTVNSLPDPGTISGIDNVCESAIVTLADPVPGGAWSASNSHAAVVAGVVAGVTAGTVTISYATTNACGTVAATFDMTVNPAPAAGSITGATAVCTGITLPLTAAAPGGTWSASNGNATVSGGIVTPVSQGTVIISYIVTNSCGSSVAIKEITITQTPNADTIRGASVVCRGDTIVLTDTAHAGVWTASNDKATVAGGVVTGVLLGTVTISYTVTNSCGISMATTNILVQDCPLKVPGMFANNDPHIFPNPVSGGLLTVVVEAGEYKDYTVFNTTDKVMLQGVLNAKETIIDFSNLAPGVYYIKLSGYGSTAIRKVVKP